MRETNLLFRLRRMIPPLLAALLLSLGPAQPLFGQQAGKPDKARIEQTLKEEQARAGADKREISRLTREERHLFGELSRLEDRIKGLEERVREEETAIEALRAEENQLLREYAALDRERGKGITALESQLGQLWPLHLVHMSEQRLGSSSWHESDRRFTWLAAMNKTTAEQLARVQEQTRLIAYNLALQEGVRDEARNRLRRVNETKDGLLADKLEFLKKIQEVRRQKLEREEELSEVLAAIGKLNYQLKSLVGKEFDQLQGRLPWPAKGRVVVSFAPDANPPSRGIGLALSGNVPVRAMDRGKVVHCDVLRGFGQVVILFHGKDYYSLYAYLSRASVALGQEVEEDQQIGEAGFYPPAAGPGLYFELRFRQKAINPEVWLIASN